MTYVVVDKIPHCFYYAFIPMTRICGIIGNPLDLLMIRRDIDCSKMNLWPDEIYGTKLYHA